MSVRLSSVLMVYFMIGAVCFGAGIVGYGNAGVTHVVIETVAGEQIETNQQTTQDVEDLGGPVEEALNTVGGGGLVSAWNFVSGLLNYLLWPVSVSVNVSAPVEVTVLVSSITFSFILGLIAMFRRGF